MRGGILRGVPHRQHSDGLYHCPAKVEEADGMLTLSLDRRGGQQCAPLLEGFTPIWSSCPNSIPNEFD